MKLARSTYYYRSRRPTAARRAVEKRIAQLCAELPRYGYRRITAQLRSEGIEARVRVYLCRDERRVILFGLKPHQSAIRRSSQAPRGPGHEPMEGSNAQS